MTIEEIQQNPNEAHRLLCEMGDRIADLEEENSRYFETITDLEKINKKLSGKLYKKNKINRYFNIRPADNRRNYCNGNE